MTDPIREFAGDQMPLPGYRIDLLQRGAPPYEDCWIPNTYFAPDIEEARAIAIRAKGEGYRCIVIRSRN